MSKRYRLQNRYQDSGWEYLAYEEFEHCGDAICRASELSEDAVAYGMVRVVDKKTGRVVITYPAGKK
jgi:hypothetical protein